MTARRLAAIDILFWFVY